MSDIERMKKFRKLSANTPEQLRNLFESLKDDLDEIIFLQINTLKPSKEELEILTEQFALKMNVLHGLISVDDAKEDEEIRVKFRIGETVEFESVGSAELVEREREFFSSILSSYVSG